MSMTSSIHGLLRQLDATGDLPVGLCNTLPHMGQHTDAARNRAERGRINRQSPTSMEAALIREVAEQNPSLGSQLESTTSEIGIDELLKVHKPV